MEEEKEDGDDRARFGRAASSGGIAGGIHFQLDRGAAASSADATGAPPPRAPPRFFIGADDDDDLEFDIDAEEEGAMTATATDFFIDAEEHAEREKKMLEGGSGGSIEGGGWQLEVRADGTTTRELGSTMTMPPPPPSSSSASQHSAGPGPSSSAAAAAAAAAVVDPAFKLDFKSVHFDPLLALYSPGLQPPRPKVRPLDNVGNFRVLLPKDDPYWIDPDRKLHRRNEASYLAAAHAKDRAMKFKKQAEEFTKREPILGKIADFSRQRGGPLDVLVGTLP